MPGHNGLRIDDYESISPARVYPPQCRPKEPVRGDKPERNPLILLNRSGFDHPQVPEDDLEGVSDAALGPDRGR
jgi:hypothetical protein